jgi:hypothetical protein
MAFTGVAVVKQVADNLVRITGISLASAGASGTIGLFPKTVAPNVRLPEGLKAHADSRPSGDVSLQDSIQVEINNTSNAAVAQPIQVVKTGTKPEDFVITLTNNSAVEGGDSGLLEIYVRWH